MTSADAPPMVLWTESFGMMLGRDEIILQYTNHYFSRCGRTVGYVMGKEENYRFMMFTILYSSMINWSSLLKKVLYPN